MAKRNWPDHIGIGRTITYNGAKVAVVDVKCGPMLVDTSRFDQPDVEIEGTLKLRVKYEGGAEEWTPPVNGKQFVEWCEKQQPADLGARGAESDHSNAPRSFASQSYEGSITAHQKMVERIPPHRQWSTAK